MQTSCHYFRVNPRGRIPQRYQIRTGFFSGTDGISGLPENVQAIKFPA